MGISPIQAVNIFRTQPVNFQEAQRTQQFAQYQQDPTLGSFKASNSPYHLEHPKVAGSETLAKHLDLMA